MREFQEHLYDSRTKASKLDLGWPKQTLLRNSFWPSFLALHRFLLKKACPTRITAAAGTSFGQDYIDETRMASSHQTLTISTVSVKSVRWVMMSHIAQNSPLLPSKEVRVLCIPGVTGRSFKPAKHHWLPIFFFLQPKIRNVQISSFSNKKEK